MRKGNQSLINYLNREWKKTVMLLLLFPMSVSGATTGVKFVYVGMTNNTALLGAKQGLKEANLQGQFLNQQYMLDIVAPNEIDDHDFSNYLAIIAATDKNTLLRLAEKLPNQAVFNLTVEDNNLRAACINNIFHIIPSAKMKSDALLQWQRKKNNSTKAVAKAWHPSFVKFAARDLNKRFKNNWNSQMDDYAWAAWASVKLSSDTVARTPFLSSREMINYLKTQLRFDGQKGDTLSFRETGQLRQRILLVTNNKIVAEAPVKPAAMSMGLDSLGILHCEK